MQRMGLFSHHSLYLACFFLLVASQPAFAQKNGVGPTVLQLPSGPGSIGGVGENVQANLNMGLMSYSINVLVPDGRGSATPSVGFTYSSSAGAGLVGIGWNLSASASVSRLTVRGLPTYSDSDQFYASGELVKVPGGPFYRARYEGGFVRYKWIQKDSSDQRGYWVAELPDGSKQYFGANAKGETKLDAQIYGAKGTFEWKLVTSVDRNGNRVEYTYFKDGSQNYIDEISWVFDKSGKALYKLRFAYEDRPDTISDGKPGFDLQTKKRITGITVTSNGQAFRSYKLAYEDATGLSRLIKVTRYGRDGKLAFPVQFSMKYSNAVFSEKTSRMVTMPTALGVDFSNRKADFLDINGDGLPDVIDTSKSKHVFHINTLTLDETMKQKSHDFASNLENPVATSGAQLDNASVQMIDYNGDGFTDMVDAVNKAIYINKGNGRWEAGNGNLDSFPVNGKDANMRFFDYNGDKAIDVISSNGSVTIYWVSDGKGNWKQVDNAPNLGVSVSQAKIRFIDINGDGLNDAVQILKSSMRYKKYLGYGNWSDWIDLNVPDIGKYELDTKAQFNDMNGDGMADMVAFLGGSIVYFVNKNGRAFSAPQQIQEFGGSGIPNSTKNSVRIADMNGNGSRDIVWINSSGKVTYLELFSERPNLMREISNGIGQRINVEYGSSVNFYIRDKDCDKDKDKACEGPWKNKMPMAFPVVTKISTWASQEKDPTAQTAPTDKERPTVQEIYYHNGFYDGIEKKFRGFRKVENIQVGDDSVKDRKELIEYNVGDTDAYFHGKLLRQETSDNAGHIYNKATYTWEDCPLTGIPGTLSPKIRYICLKKTDTVLVEGLDDPSKHRTISSEQSYDGFGNVIVSKSLGEVAKEGDEQITKTTYITPKDANDENAVWLLRYPSKMENCAKEAGPCSLTEYYYDGEAFKGLALGEIQKGNVTRTRQRVADGKWIEPSRTSYDEFGNPLASMTAEGLKREFVWDDVYNRFPSKETIKLDGYDLTMSTRWDYALSRVIESTDMNGASTRYSYDTFGRLLAKYLAGDPDGQPTIRYTYKLQAPLSTITTETRTQQGKSFDIKSISCFDGLGRTIVSLQQIKEGSFIAASHTAYNRSGGAAQRWNNYESDGTCAFVPAKDEGKTTYSYDGLGRLLQTILPNNDTQRVIYEPLKRIEYDAEDDKKDSPHFDTPEVFLLDGLQRVVEEITIPTKGKTISKFYTYNNINVSGASQIATVTLADGSVKKHDYDEIGNLRKITDPDRTTVTMTYDKENRLLTKTDGRGMTIEIAYDLLGRVLTKQQKDKPETKESFQYDLPHASFKEASNLKGRLVRVAFPGGERLVSYNTRGDVLTTKYKLMGHFFEFKSTFNNARQLVSSSLPDGRQYEYTRDGAGRMTSLSGKIKAFTYQPNGLPKSITFANGIVLSREYDKRFRIISIDVGGGKVMSLNYKFDSSNNPTSIQQAHGELQFGNTYTYDSLYRLTNASVGGQKEGLSYSHDDTHNMLKKASTLGSKSPTHIGELKYSETQIHAVTKVGDMSLSYDKAGHMTKRDNTTFVWDYKGRMTSVKEGDKESGRFWYDHNNNRVIKEEAGRHVFYVTDTYQIRHGVILSFVKTRLDHVVGSWTVKGVEAFFDDMNKDKQITATDAWLYHAHRQGFVKSSVKERPVDLDLTQDMLGAAVHRMLHGDKEINHYYHADQVGNVRAVTNDTGEVLQRRHYYPYGALRTVTGQTTLFAPGYQSTEWDASTQSWAFLMRSFDPKLGRWLSADPQYEAIGGVADEFNSYCMTEGNPMAFRDVDGRKKAGTVILGISAVASVTVGGGILAATFATSNGSIDASGLVMGIAFIATPFLVAASYKAYTGVKSMIRKYQAGRAANRRRNSSSASSSQSSYLSVQRQASLSGSNRTPGGTAGGTAGGPAGRMGEVSMSMSNVVTPGDLPNAGPNRRPSAVKPFDMAEIAQLKKQNSVSMSRGEGVEMGGPGTTRRMSSSRSVSSVDSTPGRRSVSKSKSKSKIKMKK